MHTTGKREGHIALRVFEMLLYLGNGFISTYLDKAYERANVVSSTWGTEVSYEPYLPDVFEAEFKGWIDADQAPNLQKLV